MRRLAIAFLLTGMLAGPTGIAAQPVSPPTTQTFYSNTATYEGGDPALPGKALTGRVELLSDRLRFTSLNRQKQQQTLEMPYEQFLSYHYDYEGGRGPILGVAGPHPALLATTLGLSALQLVGHTLGQRGKYRLTLECQDPQGYTTRQITFGLNSKQALLSLTQALKSQINAYQMEPQRQELVTEPDTAPTDPTATEPPMIPASAEGLTTTPPAIFASGSQP
jgi:hypothetical protein